MLKLQFWVTKSGQIPNLIIGKVSSAKNMVGFIYQNHHQMTGNSSKKIRDFGRFPPTPSTTRVNLKDFASERVYLALRIC